MSRGDTATLRRITAAAGWRAARFVVTIVAVAVLGDPLHAQPAVYDVAQVKAAFLYHFGNYVEWPAPVPEGDPVTIAVLGDAAVAAQLAEFLPGRRIGDRPVDVRPLADITELMDEELLYIGSEHNAELARLVDSVGSRGVLVVTDSPEGLEQGGMINFRLVDSRVRFEISVPRATAAQLALSSRLLAAALRVERPPQ